MTAALPQPRRSRPRTGPPEPTDEEHPALRVVHPTAPVDLVAAERAAAAFLAALAVDVDTEDRRGAPGRMARVVEFFALALPRRSDRGRR